MKLKFKDGKFTILQVSDAQDLQYVRKTMMKMLDKAYDRVKPDLIVLTGDNVLGNHFRDARTLTPLFVKTKEAEFEAMKVAIDKLVTPIEERKIPFSMIYGNHDDKNEITKKEQSDVYRQYPYFIGLDNKDEILKDETFNIPIYSEDGSKVKFNLWMMDSAWLDKEQDKSYEMVKPEAIKWYKEKSASLKEENGGEAVPSLMFQHIPLIEMLDLIEECNENDEGSFKGPEGKFFKAKPCVDGVIGEYISTVESGNGQLEAIKECGDVKAIVFGHDHQNCFTTTLDGVNIVQTSCASFRCYGKRTRGVRVFTIDEKTGDYETEHLTYADLCGDSIKAELQYIWDADGMLKEKILLCLGVGIIPVVFKKLFRTK
ncbi:MAG: metallophosphoesterase [Clostridia bacterium]|nr:metallophosphoesterase [Clostridia bacterium]